MAEDDEKLTQADGTVLLKIARDSLETFVRTGGRAPLPARLSEPLQKGFGAFVTLHTHSGQLRGCIGTMAAHGPLAETVREMAIAAGMNDPRFDEVTERELKDLKYEISVLSPLRVARAEDVKPGVHGLMIRHRGASGVLLPQVATEHGWDRESFLNHTCMKAGIEPGAWRESGAVIYTFTAQVFSE